MVINVDNVSSSFHERIPLKFILEMLPPLNWFGILVRTKIIMKNPNLGSWWSYKSALHHYDIYAVRQSLHLPMSFLRSLFKEISLHQGNKIFQDRNSLVLEILLVQPKIYDWWCQNRLRDRLISAIWKYAKKIRRILK